MYVWWDALGNDVTSLDYGAGLDAEAFRTWWASDDTAARHQAPQARAALPSAGDSAVWWGLYNRVRDLE
jgi:hypothetical protein